MTIRLNLRRFLCSNKMQLKPRICFLWRNLRHRVQGISTWGCWKSSSIKLSKSTDRALVVLVLVEVVVSVAAAKFQIALSPLLEHSKASPYFVARLSTQKTSLKHCTTTWSPKQKACPWTPSNTRRKSKMLIKRPRVEYNRSMVDALVSK